MSDEYPVYLTTERASIERFHTKRTLVASDAAFEYLGDGGKGLLRRHATPEGSLKSSQTYIRDLFIELGGESEVNKWKGVIEKVQRLTVCLTHLFSGKKGVWLGKGLQSRLMLGIKEATGTGYWDDVHQKTAGFLFFLGHFGHPFDLKHLSVYGKESTFPGWHDGQGESYAQRRFVCLDADASLYATGLVMIHDAVWPRHLMGKSKAKVGVECEAIYEDVNSGVRLFGELPTLGSKDYDPHQATDKNDYIRAEVLHLRCNSRTTRLRPLDSVVAGCCFRQAVALEVVRFATLLGKAPQSLDDYGKLILFINEWIRPQVMLPWQVAVPEVKDVQSFDLWSRLPKPESSSEVDGYLVDHYKKVGEDWQPLLRLSSRKVDSELENQAPFKSPYYQGKNRPPARGGLRAFGWPRQKYARKDVRTIGAPLSDTLKATGDRSEYQTLWNGLPELVAYSAFHHAEVTLDRSAVGKPSTVIHPFEQSLCEASLKWDARPVS